MSTNHLSDRLYVQMFGHLSITWKGQSIDEEDLRSEMLTRLLVYFLVHRKKEITTRELVEALWKDDESKNPGGALKNLIYRMRNIMKEHWPQEEFILTGRGCYQWNSQIAVDTDAELFEESIKGVEEEESQQEMLERYTRGLHLYKGVFLPNLSEEYWIATLGTYYHSMFLSSVKAAAQILEQQEKYELMDQLCKEALEIDNLDEGLYCSYIKALSYQKKYQLADELYHRAASILYKELGVEPSRELKEIYSQLLKQNHVKAKSVRVIKQDLLEEDRPGALLYEYGVFKKTCQMEQRRARRLGVTTYLSLITVSAARDIPSGTIAYRKFLNYGMEQLGHVLLKQLRAGDVISKYSHSQYIVMLPDCGYEMAQKVMKRIENCYYQQQYCNQICLQYSLDEMECAVCSK